MSLTSRPLHHARPGTAVPKAALDELLGKDSGARTASAYEERRLMDMLKVKERTIEEQMREISTLKTNLAKAQKDLMQKQSQMEGATEKAAQALGGAAARSKELDMLKADKHKLESQVDDMRRQVAKLRDQLTAAQEKNPGVAHQLASMQSTVRSAQASAAAAEKELAGIQNQLRNKDKELARMTKMVDEVTTVLARNGELENRVREVNKQLDDAQTELRGRDALLRQRDADIAKLNKEVMSLKEALSAGNAAHADTMAQAKALGTRVAEQDVEMNRLRDELARTGAVAARVAAAEVRAGSKDEGTVHITQHIEEIKYWQAETSRLKDKVAALEKQLQVADELKSRYRATAERLGSAPGSRSPSPSRTRTPSSAGGAAMPHSASRSCPGNKTTPRTSLSMRQLRASILDAAAAVSQDANNNDKNVRAADVSAAAKPPAPGRVTRARSKAGAGSNGGACDTATSRKPSTRNTRSASTIENDTMNEADVTSK